MHALCQFHMHAVARAEIAARLGNADDRLSVAQFLGRDAIIHEPFQIQRGHIHAFEIAGPVARTKAPRAFGRVGQVFCPALSVRAKLGAASELRRTTS